LAGQAYVSNVDRCAQIADAIPGNIVLFEGSGSAIPNVATDRRILVVSAHQPLDTIAQYLGPLRIINSHLVALTMCEEPIASEHSIRAMEDAIRATNPRARIVRTIFRPRPLSDVQGKRIVLCTTSSDAALPLMTRHLEETFGCSVVASTNRLSNRSALQADLAGFGDRGAHVVLTELKAAAVDVATSWGIANGLDVAYMDNEPLPASSQYSLQEEILALARQAVEQHSRIHSAASCVD
jgi:cyclic 2,3-diphosphoglycerate synthetase